MKDLIKHTVLEKVFPIMKEQDLEYVYICTKFSEGGGSVTEGYYLDKNGSKHIGLLKFDKKPLREYQNHSQTDPARRFNTVEFEVYRDGSYKAHYYWDEGIIDDQKRRKAQQMAGWLAQRIPVMISYQGYALYDQFHFEGDILNNEEESNEYGNRPGWRAGVFTFDFRNNDLKINIEVEKAAGRVSLPLHFEDWFIHDLWEHYEITTKGMLSKEWQPWNVLEIKLEKDTGHDGGKTIEPEMRYLLF